MKTWPTRACKSGCRRGRGRTWCAASRWATSSAGATPATLAASASGRRPARPPTAGNARLASGIWVPGPPCHPLPPSWPSFSGRSSSQLCAARPVQPAIKPHWFSLGTGCLLTGNGSQTARQFNSGRYAHVNLNRFLQPPLHILYVKIFTFMVSVTPMGGLLLLWNELDFTKRSFLLHHQCRQAALKSSWRQVFRLQLSGSSL